MKISVNWIKQFVDFELPPVDELVEKIGAQLGEVEAVVDLGKKYQGIIVARVVSCAKHPDADKLQVCKIDDDGKTQNVERDDAGYVQVVCGAPNVRAGLSVAWLPPGATVPATYDKEPLVLEARDIRGQKSNGMLASSKELAISDDHNGILEIDKGAAPGTDFAALYRLDDYIIDIENKMFTHRPDCFGALGVAREIAGILGHKFTSPDWYVTTADFPKIEVEELPLKVTNELPELVPCFTAVTLRDVKVSASPLWLQVALMKVGAKPINNVVDLTNFWVLVTGQPLHAYDYDKVKALSDGDTKIVIRKSRKGEKIKLLNGKEIEPRAEAIMIATDKQPIGIGGVMGGSDTEVDASTKNIILECANFGMYSIRRTAMEHGLFTDAVTRFSKGQSPLQCLAVLAKITDEIRTIANGKVASELINVQGDFDDCVLDDIHQANSIGITEKFINDRLGLQLEQAQIITLLENVEFKVEVDKDGLEIFVPFWRTDIEIPEDIVEEVGRLYGYDQLPLELPKRNLTPAPKDPLLELKARIRAALAKAGANEVLTYSFVHGDLLDKVGQDGSQAFQIANALSPDLQYYRLSLTPSLLEKVHPNIKAGYAEFALFELGKAHVLNESDPAEPEIPKEANALSLVCASKKAGRSTAYYQARTYLISLLSEFRAGHAVCLEKLAGADLYNNPWLIQMTAPFEPQRSAVLRDTGGLIWGVVGEFKSSVRRGLKLPAYAAGFEIDPLLLMLQGQQTSSYVPLPRFPKVTQDITLRVAADLTYQELYDYIQEALDAAKPQRTYLQLSPLDIFQHEGDQAHRQITFRLEIASYERTLTDKEVNSLLDQVAAKAREKYNAERV